MRPECTICLRADEGRGATLFAVRQRPGAAGQSLNAAAAGRKRLAKEHDFARSANRQYLNVQLLLNA